MRTVYALQFEVQPEPNPSQSLAMFVGVLAERLADWVRDKYRKNYHLTCEPKFDSRVLQPCEEHHFLGTDGCIDQMRLCTVAWQHPDITDSTVLWNTTCMVASDGERVQITFMLRLSSSRFIVKPTLFSLGRPRVLSHILNEYRCRIDREIIPTRPRNVALTDVPALIQDRLLFPDRVLPTIVVTTDTYTDKPLLDPGKLQADLLGFAEVVVMKDKWAAFRFTDAIGRNLTCFNGAVRLYWPGLRADSEGLEHRLFFPDRVAEIEREQGGLGQYLFRLFASISSFRLSEGKVIRRVRQALDAQRSAQIETLRVQVQEGTLAQQDLRAFLADMERTLDENTRLRSELEVTQLRALELQEEVEQHKSNLTELFQYREQQTERKQQPDDEPATVEEALKRAYDRFSDLLFVYETAFDSAQNSNFARPGQVYEALLAIAEVGDEWRKARELGRGFKPLKNALQEKVSFKYATSESQQTMDLYGEERRFSHQGSSRVIEEHLTLGGGDRINCLQIYFCLDEDTRKVHVGYCGVHLSHANMRT